MIDTKEVITQKFPKIKKLPNPIKKTIFKAAKKLVYEDEINNFLEKNRNLDAFEFIDAVLEYFNFSYKYKNNQIENIPVSGKVVIIANHPLGALDALSLIQLVRKVRKDIKIVANDILMNIEQLKDILLGVDAFGYKTSRSYINDIYNALDNEEAVIIFPSGKVSRARPTGIKDTKWHSGFLKFAIKKSAPILPIYIKSKNSSLFYTISALNKNISAALLPHEMFNKKNKSLEFVIGELISYNAFKDKNINIKTKVKLFKKHLYKIAKNKKPIFETEKCIAHPENRQDLKEELANSKLLGKTNDNKLIYLFKYQPHSAVMKEIGRLREVTFRKVEEGTGKKRDLDNFDEYYKHIVLWDENRLEIVGSYRIGNSREILQTRGFEGFYTNSLFKFEKEFKKYLENSIELGRSFVQPAYWGSKALDYLWQGIGAYLYNNPDIKYMFGTVSLSASLPQDALNAIVYYYQKYYSTDEKLVTEIKPFKVSNTNELSNLFSNKTQKDDYMALRDYLRNYSVTIPTLYKHYTELCEDGGVEFLGFNIDEDFNDCIDGFILVKIDKVKEKKRKRYIKS
jgi:putative hemolysin